MRELLDAERAQLYIVDDETQELWHGAEGRTTRLPMSTQGGSYVASCAVTGNTINLCGDEIQFDGVHESRSSPSRSRSRRGRTLSAYARKEAIADPRSPGALDNEKISLLCMAVRGHKGAIIAVIEVWNKRRGYHSPQVRSCVH